MQNNQNLSDYMDDLIFDTDELNAAAEHVEEVYLRNLDGIDKRARGLKYLRCVDCAAGEYVGQGVDPTYFVCVECDRNYDYVV